MNGILTKLAKVLKLNLFIESFNKSAGLAQLLHRYSAGKTFVNGAGSV